MSERKALKMDEKLAARLEETASEIGLSQSEIIRRGIIEQVKQLES